jgi:putative transposase
MATGDAAHAVELAFVHPDEPAQNTYIERFNRSFREAVLDAYLFSSLRDAREITATWIEEYNAICPHEAWQNRSPYQYTTVNMPDYSTFSCYDK